MKTTVFAQIVSVQMIGTASAFQGRRIFLDLEDLCADEREEGVDDADRRSMSVDLSPDESRGIEVGQWRRLDVSPMSPEDTDALAKRQAKREAEREKRDATKDAHMRKQNELLARSVEAQERMADVTDPSGKKPRKKGE
jgi:hypothetical protein